MKEYSDNRSLFRFKQFSLENNVAGLKIGTDGVLLGAWSQTGESLSIWDIGTGTGVIALMLAQRSDALITGFEIDPHAASVAASNFRNSPWAGRMKIIEGDAVEMTKYLDPADIIISNPPYSLKNQVLARLYAIGKPFAMLINFQGIFDSRERFRLFKENRVEMLWLSPRVAYMTEGRQPRQGVPFQSGYLCSGICENQLEFEYLDRQEKE